MRADFHCDSQMRITLRKNFDTLLTITMWRKMTFLIRRNTRLAKSIC